MFSEPYCGLCGCALEFIEITTPTDPYAFQHKKHHPFSATQTYIGTFSNLDQQQHTYCSSTCTSENTIQENVNFHVRI